MSIATQTDPAYEPFEPDYLRWILGQGFYDIADYYFRGQLIGAEKLPERGPMVLAPNHSGSSFPWDAMVLDALLWRRDGERPEARYRTAYEKILSQHWWMRPFGIDDFWRRCGGVDLTFDNFDRLLARGERVSYYPEGVAGIGKGFQHRYELQPFSTSFLILAARHGAPIYPVHVVNAEWVIPFNFMLKPVDFLMYKLFGVPFLPLPGGIAAILFPWIWYVALPARMVLVVGEPIDAAELARDEGVTDFERPDRAAMKRVAERVRKRWQADLDENVRRYGRQPYHLRSLARAFGRARRAGKLHRVLPMNWAYWFSRLDRDRRREPARNRLHAVLRDWDLLAFYLPLGWPLLSLARALRRPPYGYRGLDRATRRRDQGCYLWRLP